MAKLLFIGTYGTDDPTRATMPFVGAVGALMKGHDPTVLLMGESVYMLRGQVLEHVHGVGFPPLRDLVDKILGEKVPLYA